MTDETTAPATELDIPTTDGDADTAPSAANNYKGIEDSSRQDDGKELEPDDTELSENTEESTEEPDPWSDYVDFELDGAVHKIPAALKDGFYRAKDYTQKTQALAEERRALETHKEEVSRLGQISEQEINLRVDLAGLEKTLGQYANLDWEAFEAEDFMRAQTEWRKFQQLKENVNQKQGELQQAHTERKAIADRDLDNRIKQTAKYAYENLPGMSPDLDSKITDFAIKTLGYPPDTLKQSYNPQIYTTLYLAYLGQQTLSNRQAQAKSPQKVPTKQPLTVVSAKSPSTGRKSLHEMAKTNFEDYRSTRMAQLEKAGRR